MRPRRVFAGGRWYRRIPSSGLAGKPLEHGAQSLEQSAGVRRHDTNEKYEARDSQRLKRRKMALGVKQTQLSVRGSRELGSTGTALWTVKHTHCC